MAGRWLGLWRGDGMVGPPRRGGRVNGTTMAGTRASHFGPLGERALPCRAVGRDNGQAPGKAISRPRETAALPKGFAFGMPGGLVKDRNRCKRHALAPEETTMLRLAHRRRDTDDERSDTIRTGWRMRRMEAADRDVRYSERARCRLHASADAIYGRAWSGSEEYGDRPPSCAVPVRTISPPQRNVPQSGRWQAKTTHESAI